jgi:hypothetical protein
MQFNRIRYKRKQYNIDAIQANLMYPNGVDVSTLNKYGRK